MKEQNKDSLENFFREGAQKYNIEFEEGDWQKLEAQLDKEMPVAFSFRTILKKYWPYAFLLLMMPGAWYTYSSLSRPDSPPHTLESTDQDTRNKGESGTISDPELALEQESESQILNMQEGESSDYDQSFQDEEEVGNDFYSIAVEGRHENQEMDPKNTREIVDMADPESEVGAMVISSEESSVYSQENKDNYPTFSSDQANAVSVHQITWLQSAGLPDIKILPQPMEIETFVTPPQEDDTLRKGDAEKDRKVSFYAGVGFSPDFSTVGMGNFIAPGFRWNGMLEIGFAKRFRLNTGIVWIKNKYEAYGEEYQAPPGYWHNGIVPEETYGECVMIDIPLNVRYDIIKKDRHKIFLSAGSSTYLVMKEDYYFYYQSYDPDLPKYWGTDETTTYPFGIINISFGYQYDIGRRGAIQVEPFIKLPTSGIGWGNVDLHTVGMYFMYKYRIGR